jgi:hypothetical protein
MLSGLVRSELGACVLKTQISKKHREHLAQVAKIKNGWWKRTRILEKDNFM